MDQVKRGPGRPRKHPEGVSVEPVEAPEREPYRPELLFALPIPAWLRTSAIPVDSLATFPSDVRCAVEARLGCLFTLKDGNLTTADGRLLRVEIEGDECKVFER